MSAKRRVLITGVSTFWGTELAARLETDPTVEYVAGLDTEPPLRDLERTEYIKADIRNPVIVRLLPSTKVDTVVHADIAAIGQPGKGRARQHDIHVIGTLQLLAACEKADSLRTLVVRGSAAIYGAEPTAPSFFSEDMARRFPLRTQFQRDLGELESYFETFARRHAQVTCTVVRCQPMIGMGVNTSFTRYLRQPVVPTHLGYDPRMQFVHEDDAVGALAAAVKNPVRGAVNVAGEGTIGLTKLLRLAGKPTLPLPAPLLNQVMSSGRRLGMPELSPDFVRFLCFGRAVTIDRLKDEVGYRPSYTTLEACTDFITKLRGHRLVGRPAEGAIGVA